jgi:hypothetical protein
MLLKITCIKRTGERIVDKAHDWELTIISDSVDCRYSPGERLTRPLILYIVAGRPFLDSDAPDALLE